MTEFSTGNALVTYSPDEAGEPGAASRAAAFQEQLGKPTPHPRAPEPVPAAPPALDLKMGSIATRPVAPFAFAPGKVTAEHHGASSIETRNVLGLSFTFIVNDPRALSAEPDVAAAAAKARLEKVRAAFKSHPLYLNLKRVSADLEALKAKTIAVQNGPADALSEYRTAVLTGADTSAAEQNIETAERQLKIHATKVAALAESEKNARAAAVLELRKLVAAERARIHAEADTEARELAERITALVAATAERLLAANKVAGLMAPTNRVAASWGGSAEFASELP